jgi:nucleoside-diphosphate-sugar epimerase
MKKDIKNILVTGGLGQIGSELIGELRNKYGSNNVVATDMRDATDDMKDKGPYHILDIKDTEKFEKLIKDYKIDTIVHLAAILSGVGEKNPALAWDVNMNGTINVLNLGLKYEMSQIFIPSSIAVWGPDCPKVATQDSPLHPTTMYGVTKVAGEVLCDYYFKKYGLDVRGVRFPGIISSETPPGGGTTDYAVEIYYEAVKNNHYKCFVREDTRLPMMYMPDCLKSVIDLMAAPLENLKHHSSFNLGSMSFDVRTLADSVKKYMPGFTIDYVPDFRQAIADSWPDTVIDTPAREEWGWSPSYNLDLMTIDMLEKLKNKQLNGLL